MFPIILVVLLFACEPAPEGYAVMPGDQLTAEQAENLAFDWSEVAAKKTSFQ